jgi:hypothetical protein
MEHQKNWIDDGAFYVEKARWGTWKSYGKNEKELITSLTEENCIHATRFYLKGLQEGWGDQSTYGGKIEYKL